MEEKGGSAADALKGSIEHQEFLASIEQLRNGMLADLRGITTATEGRQQYVQSAAAMKSLEAVQVAAAVCAVRSSRLLNRATMEAPAS